MDRKTPLTPGANNRTGKNDTGNPRKQQPAGISPEVLWKMRDGDHDAFRTVYLAYVKQILTFIKYLTRSEVEAEEITQQVFVKIWEKRETIDPALPFSGYIFTIARNAALQYWRSLDNRVLLPAEEYADRLYNISDGAYADSHVIKSETELLVQIAVSRMPQMQRKVYEMSVVEGLSTEEISDKLKISNSTVFSYLSVARKQIKELIALIFLLFLQQ